MCICVLSASAWVARRGRWIPGAKITGSFEPSMQVPVTECVFFARAVSVCDHRAFSSASFSFSWSSAHGLCGAFQTQTRALPTKLSFRMPVWVCILTSEGICGSGPSQHLPLPAFVTLVIPIGTQGCLIVLIIRSLMTGCQTKISLIRTLFQCLAHFLK